MASSTPYFITSGRASENVLKDEIHAIEQADFVATLLDAMPALAMILNEHRQIIAVNNRLLQVFGLTNASQLIGRRPGEALGCIHSCQGPDGCGTAPDCAVCGAVRSIFSSQESGRQASAECRIMLKKDGGTALDLEATASPLLIANNRLTVFTLRDISAKKRKQVLEHTFFHDIINTAGGIHGIACLLAERENLPPVTEREYKELMVSLSDNLIEEIKHQRRLIAAERGEYVPQLEEVDLDELLRGVCELFRHHERVPERKVCYEAGGEYRVRTDPPVLRRIVGNMVLNAMEAIKAGETVQIRSHRLPDSYTIEVSNPGEMSDDIRLNMFKRSFSSKAPAGRGIGTYSMKLFGERYLGGSVGFTSSGGVTTFFIELPR